MDGIGSRRPWLRFAVSVLVFATAFAQASSKRAIAQSHSVASLTGESAATDDTLPGAASSAEIPKGRGADATTPGNESANAMPSPSEEQPNSPSSGDLALLAADAPNMFGDFWSSGAQYPPR